MSDIGTRTANTICMVYIMKYDLRDDYMRIYYYMYINVRYRHYIIHIIYNIVFHII